MRDWYKNKAFQVLCHVLAWVVFFSLPVLLRPEFPRDNIRIARPPFFTPENMLTHVFLVVIFYFNAYFLIPRFLNRKKIATYILSVLAVLVVTTMVALAARTIHEKRVYESGRVQEGTARTGEPDAFARLHRRGLFMRQPMIFTVFSVMFVLAVSITYRFVLDKLRQDSLQQLQQNERLKTELSFLRSQISPHFIFNILNSAVSLARAGSDQLEPTLIKLSNLLRYMLYNADDEKVPLSQEVEYLGSYIDLQKIRFEEDVRIRFTRTGIFLGHMIEPMLLIPFVENAFKHGIGHIGRPAIFIDLQEENGHLRFHVRNKFNPARREAQDKNSGIGLPNVKKRLKLLYDDRYSLDINVDGEWFDAKLNLELK